MINNKIIKLSKNKSFEWFDHMIHKVNSSYVNHLNTAEFYNRKLKR